LNRNYLTSNLTSAPAPALPAAIAANSASDLKSALRSLHHSTMEISLPSAEAPAKPSKLNSTDVV